MGKKQVLDKGRPAIFPAIGSSCRAWRCEAKPKHLFEGPPLFHEPDQLCNNGSTLYDVIHIICFAPQLADQLCPPALRGQCNTPPLEKSLSLFFCKPFLHQLAQRLSLTPKRLHAASPYKHVSLIWIKHPYKDIYVAIKRAISTHYDWRDKYSKEKL